MLLQKACKINLQVIFAIHLSMGGLRRCWILIGLVSTDHQAKEFQKSDYICLSCTQIGLESPHGLVLVKSACSISLSEVTRTGKSSSFANQKAHGKFKNSYELVGTRATTFTEGIFPGNVVFFGDIVFADFMFVGHFDHSAVKVRLKVLK